MVINNHTKEIKVSIPKSLYLALESIARKEGYSTLQDYVISILTNIVTQATLRDDMLDKLRIKLERYIQDEVNKRTTIIEVLRKQLTELYERLEALEQRVNIVEELARQVGLEKLREKVEFKRKTAIERLKEDKILFESKLPPKIQRDRFFAYLERSGAVVLKLTRERIAVDRDFWNEFKNKLLNELNSNRDEDAIAMLGKVGYELWKALYNDNLLIYDPKTKRWRFVQGSVP